MLKSRRQVLLAAAAAAASSCSKQPEPASTAGAPPTFNAGPLPANDEDIAYAPVSSLSRWVKTRKLASERLTNIYLERIARFDRNFGA